MSNPPLLVEMLWSVPFSDKLFQPFSQLDFQQPRFSWFSYAQKWRKPSNPNSFKQLKAFIIYTHAPPWLTWLPIVPVMNAPRQAGLSSSWLPLVLTAVTQVGLFCIPSPDLSTCLDPNHPWRPCSGLHGSSPSGTVSAVTPGAWLLNWAAALLSFSLNT